MVFNKKKEIIPANEMLYCFILEVLLVYFGKEHCDSLQKLLWSDEEKDHVTVYDIIRGVAMYKLIKMD